jgi:hypothetical protein
LAVVPSPHTNRSTPAIPLPQVAPSIITLPWRHGWCHRQWKCLGACGRAGIASDRRAYARSPRVPGQGNPARKQGPWRIFCCSAARLSRKALRVRAESIAANVRPSVRPPPALDPLIHLSGCLYWSLKLAQHRPRSPSPNLLPPRPRASKLFNTSCALSALPASLRLPVNRARRPSSQARHPVTVVGELRVEQTAAAGRTVCTSMLLSGRARMRRHQGMV